MELAHVALNVSSEEKADLFYKDLLGLQKSTPRSIPAHLAKAIFGIDKDIPMIHYTSQNLDFEIFVTGETSLLDPGAAHVCITIHNREEFLAKCEALSVQVIRIAKGEGFLVFVKDLDGNLFEVKVQG